MREIKFRAWNPRANCMVYQPTLENYAHPDGSQGYHHAFRQGCILMQFTGFEDKNGKEIYEGDLSSFSLINSKVQKIKDEEGLTSPGLVFMKLGLAIILS